MKIAVLGGGTAGYIAAAHVSRMIPQAQLLHVFDSRIPTIGVGEGTTPRFPQWLHEISGLRFEDLAQRCGATLKHGVRFEGWGKTGTEFFNRFQPSTMIGYHIDAREIVQIIAEHVRASQIDEYVEDMTTAEDTVTLLLKNGTRIACDYVFDARGFPRADLGTAGADSETLDFDWIPTNRARLRWLRPDTGITESHAVARPHGWIFQLPLRDRVNCGYVFNADISSDGEVEADFDRFLGEKNVQQWQERGALDFPNFMRTRLSDGRVFRIGNAASFIEPLEATAIGTGIVQVRAAVELIIESETRGNVCARSVSVYNDTMTTYIRRNSLFVAWHYRCGAKWQGDFWRHAEQGLRRAGECSQTRSDLRVMSEFVESARQIPASALGAIEDHDQWNREVFPLLTQYLPFGNFSQLNFAQVGHGIGYYQVYPGPAVAVSS